MANTRLGANQYNQGNQFQRGQYIYGQGSQANLGFANNQQQQEQEYRGYLTGAQNQASQNTQVGNQQRLGAYSAQNQGMQGATTGAIQNYAVPGAWKQGIDAASNLIGAAAKWKPQAKGGTFKGPTPALIGEAGPELLIDLQPAAYGGEFDDEDTTKYGTVPQVRSGPQPEEEGPSKKGSPLYEAILRSLTSTPKATDPTHIDDPSKLPGMAAGGVAGKHHYYGSRSKLKGPKISLVTKPHITTLGLKGPQAVIPLTPRKSNKLNPSDIPSLIKKYSGRK